MLKKFLLLMLIANADMAQAMSVDDQLQAAKRNLAARAEVEVDAIKVATIMIVRGRSGAIGCPEPGVSYPDELVQGVLIMLQIEGKLFRYHAALDEAPFHCSLDRAEKPIIGKGS